MSLGDWNTVLLSYPDRRDSSSAKRRHVVELSTAKR